MNHLLSTMELSKITGGCTCGTIKGLIGVESPIRKGPILIPKPEPVKPKPEIM